MNTAQTAPVFVSSAAVRAVFQWPEAIAALQEGYARQSDPGAVPARTIAKAERTWLRTLPAIPPGGRYYGAKLMGMAMGAAIPGAEYVIVLFDRQTSRIAAFIDGNLVTGLRTAATTAAALDRLAPAGPACLAVLGSGLEAAMHLRAFASVRPLQEVRVFSPKPERREAFAAEARRDLGIVVQPVATPQAAVEGAGLVLAAARSRGEEPILHADWLAPEARVFSIGSTVPEQREVDVSVIAFSDLIVADVLEEVLEQTGDLLAARAAGIDAHSKAISLAALLDGSQAERLSTARAPLYKSVGSGLQDILVAELILTRALQAGLTTPLPITFDTKR